MLLANADTRKHTYTVLTPALRSFCWGGANVPLSPIHEGVLLCFKERDHWQKTARWILLKIGQSTWKNPIRFMVKRKRGVASHFWPHKMHVKELIWLAQSQCYGIGRKKLIWGCQGSLLKIYLLQCGKILLQLHFRASNVYFRSYIRHFLKCISACKFMHIHLEEYH
jgi:hypothetical protein